MVEDDLPTYKYEVQQKMADWKRRNKASMKHEVSVHDKIEIDYDVWKCVLRDANN